MQMDMGLYLNIFVLDIKEISGGIKGHSYKEAVGEIVEKLKNRIKFIYCEFGEKEFDDPEEKSSGSGLIIISRSEKTGMFIDDAIDEYFSDLFKIHEFDFNRLKSYSRSEHGKLGSSSKHKFLVGKHYEFDSELIFEIHKLEPFEISDIGNIDNYLKEFGYNLGTWYLYYEEETYEFVEKNFYYGIDEILDESWVLDYLLGSPSEFME